MKEFLQKTPLKHLCFPLLAFLIFLMCLMFLLFSGCEKISHKIRMEKEKKEKFGVFIPDSSQLAKETSTHVVD